MSTQTIGFITYNVNYSRRAVMEFEEYSWENRRGSVYGELAKIVPETQSKADIIFLQEILSQNMQEVETSLADYKWHFEATNARDGVCCNGIGIKKGILPEQAQQKFVFNFNAYEKTAEKVLGLLIGDMCLVNVHFPMEEQGRMAMAEHFSACLPKDREYRLIIAGNFNAFPDAKGTEQIKLLCKVTGTIAVSDLAISEVSKNIATRSFKAYPYDKVPETALALPGKLDHVLIKGLQVATGTGPIVMDAATVPNKTFSPSDHYPIRIVFTRS